jgi:uncharacterized damage-inducible protein DinB
MATKASPSPTFISAADLLDHWQGHRRLTRRTIEVFPDDQLFKFSIGGMRTFGEMASELIGMAAPMAKGLIANEWDPYTPVELDSKKEVLRLWDESTKKLDDFWAQIPAGRFKETVTSFGQFNGPVHWQILYAIDNEVHHRAQAYVYLRALRIEPPLFYQRD